MMEKHMEKRMWSQMETFVGFSVRASLGSICRLFLENEVVEKKIESTTLYSGKVRETIQRE